MSILVKHQTTTGLVIAVGATAYLGVISAGYYRPDAVEPDAMPSAAPMAVAVSTAVSTTLSTTAGTASLISPLPNTMGDAPVIVVGALGP